MERSPYTLLQRWSKFCQSCHREHPPVATSEVALQRCGGCLVAHYCNAECMEHDEAKHQARCASMAVFGFRATCKDAAGTNPYWSDD